jgi:hypothetical protein
MRLALTAAHRTISVAAVLFCAAACTAILGLDEKSLAPADGGPHSDASVHTDAAGGGCTADSMGYHDMATAACWTTYDVSDTVGAIGGLLGGTFDGRYVYFAPIGTEPVVRYDTQGTGFGATSSWTPYNPAAMDDAGVYSDEYAGAVFDGRYVYFIPADLSPAFLRYDSHADFTSASSWTQFTLTQASAGGYAGGVFDGRYIYFAPMYDSNDDTSGVVARYDTTGSFRDEATAWAYFDTTTVSTNAGGFAGAIFDGQYVYFVPNAPDTVTAVLARYDTTAAFTSKSAWASFNAANGYQTGAFDGKSLYFAPYAQAPALQKTLGAALNDIPSWSRLVPQDVDKKASSSLAAYDGRFVYFAPWYNGEGTSLNSVMLRYDASETAFGQTTSWSSFDLATLPLKPGDFGAAVFDGRYLYLAPADAGAIVARFDAKETSAQPKLPGYHGSFF